MKRRSLILIVLMVFLTSPLLASTALYPYESPSTTDTVVDYDGGGSVTWGCLEEGNDGTMVCPDATLEDMPDYSMKVYNDNGELFTTVHEYDFNNKWSDNWGYEFNLDLPKNNVDYGRLNVELWYIGGNSEKIDEGTIFVNGTTENPNRAPYLYLKMDTDPSPHQLKVFALSDDKWSKTDILKQGSLSVEEEDGEDDFWPGTSYDRCTYYPLTYEALQSEDAEGETGILRNIPDWSWAAGETGSCGSGADSIMEQQFDQGVEQRIGIDYSGSYGINTVSPAHKNGDFIIDGQLARGYEPNIPGNSELNGQGPYWYVCRDGADYPRSAGSGGKTISLQPEEGGQLLRCDAEGNGTGYRDETPNDWEEVTECQDGLDNNDNDKVDTDDPACNNNPSTEIEGGQVCQPVVGVPESGGSKAAFYDVSGDSYSPQSSDCTYGEIDTDLHYTNQPAELFECTSSGGGTAVADNYSGPTPDAADSFCSNIANTEEMMTIMPAVQYFVPKTAMTPGSTRWAREDTSYQEGGFRPNDQFQTLHTAENKYNWAKPHDPTGWAEHNMDNQSYEDYTDNHEEFLNAWDVANASGYYSEDITYPTRGTLDQDNVFKGGFYGDCPSYMNWTYSGGEWLCDVGSAGETTITINSYRMGSDDLGGKLAGFQVNWTEMQKWQGGHPAAPPQGSEDGWIDNVKVKAMCWQGAQSERPQDLNKAVNLTAEVQGGQTTYVVGEMPDRGSVANPSQYTCVFGFSQQVHPERHTISAASDVFYQGNEGPCTTCRYIYGYITEGTNDAKKGNIFIEDQRIRPADHTPPDQSMQDWLGDKNTADTGKDLWEHFPRSENVGTNRNPWQACMNRDECGVAG